MTNKEAVIWIINLTADIGKIQHQDLWHYEQALSEIREMIEAEPERKTGRWMESDTDRFVCSECRNGYRNQPTLMGKPMFEYCPVCGCKMEVEND